MIVWGGFGSARQHWRQIQPQHRQLDSDQHHQRADSPEFSHRSVDWQRNDRLGRIQRHLFEHRRAILRGYTNRNANTNSYADPNPNSNGYGDCHSNSDDNTDRDARPSPTARPRPTPRPRP